MIQLPSDVPKAKEKPSRTHKGTQALSSGHLSVSEGDSQKKRKKFSKELEREEESRDLTQDDTKDHLYGGGSCGWIRTNDLVVNSHPLYRWATEESKSLRPEGRPGGEGICPKRDGFQGKISMNFSDQ